MQAVGSSCLGATIASAAPADAGRRKIAIVTAEWRYHSHAWQMREPFLAGYPVRGKWHRPSLDESITPHLAVRIRRRGSRCFSKPDSIADNQLRMEGLAPSCASLRPVEHIKVYRGSANKQNIALAGGSLWT
jgi:hypothetical protein